MRYARSPVGVDPDLRTPRGRRFLPRGRAWCLGAPLGVLAGGLMLLMWLMVHPLALVGVTRQALAESGWRIVVDDATMDYGAGITTPSSWRWHVRGLAVIGLLPGRPTILIDDLVLAPPRPSWGDDGLVFTTPYAHARRLDLHFEEVTRQAVPPPPGARTFTLVVQALDLESFGMTMRKGINPEVIVEAANISLVAPFHIHPWRRGLTGELVLERASVDIAGVRIDDIVPSRIAFTGLGFEATVRGKLGDTALDATLAVYPLIGPPQVKVQAHLHEGTLSSLADAILGPGPFSFVGRVEVTAELTAGGDLGRGNLAGSATVNVRDAGFARPTARRGAIVLAVRLAPFLTFNLAGDVIIGDFHGDVSFTQLGVAFDTVTYEAAHSIGELRGYARSNGLSAKLHFRPRERSGAIEWGFVIRGTIRKPKVALALPAVLRAWTPCEDSSDCALVGGKSKTNAREDAEEERVADALARESDATRARATREAARGARRGARADDRAEAVDARKRRREAKAD